MILNLGGRLRGSGHDWVTDYIFHVFFLSCFEQRVEHYLKTDLDIIRISLFCNYAPYIMYAIKRVSLIKPINISQTEK